MSQIHSPRREIYDRVRHFRAARAGGAGEGGTGERGRAGERGKGMNFSEKISLLIKSRMLRVGAAGSIG